MKIREITMGDVRHVVRKGCRRMAQQIQRSNKPSSQTAGQTPAARAPKRTKSKPTKSAGAVPRVPASIRNPPGSLTYQRLPRNKEESTHGEWSGNWWDGEQ